jgi:DNA-binding transcriptional LysR family regulator
MALDLYQLKVFWTFAKFRHFTKTAERLYVTQSAISHALKKLERSVGTDLIARHAGQYRLTEAGEALLVVCEKVFREIDHYESEYQRDPALQRQKLRLGAPVEFGTTVLVGQLGKFITRHPHIHLAFHFSHHLHTPLLHGELDLIVDCRPCHHPEVERIFLFRERYVVIATPEFMRQHDIGKPADLEHVPVLSMDETGEWWNNFIFAQPGGGRTVLTHIIQINHVRGLINGALAGLGISFVPRYTVENELRDGRLCDVFPGGHLMDDHFCVYVKRDKREIDKNKRLIAFLQECFSGFDVP